MFSLSQDCTKRIKPIGLWHGSRMAILHGHCDFTTFSIAGTTEGCAHRSSFRARAHAELVALSELPIVGGGWASQCDPLHAAMGLGGRITPAYPVRFVRSDFGHRRTVAHSTGVPFSLCGKVAATGFDRGSEIQDTPGEQHAMTLSQKSYRPCREKLSSMRPIACRRNNRVGAVPSSNPVVLISHNFQIEPPR